MLISSRTAEPNRMNGLLSDVGREFGELAKPFSRLSYRVSNLFIPTHIQKSKSLIDEIFSDKPFNC